MDYIAGGTKEPGCVFCNRSRARDDRAALILHRGVHCFVIMNLFPYAIGHLMIVPYEHVAGPEQAAPAALREMADLLPICLRFARSALDCAGFNVGINLGNVAGAGVADHLHEHVVPRWLGDANFMPMIASTSVLPELIPVTYAKLRAEFERCGSPSVRLVVLNESARKILVEREEGNPRLPFALMEEKEAVWRTALDALARFGVRAKVIDWAGSESTNDEAASALLLQTDSSGLPTGFYWEKIETLGSLGLSDTDAAIAGRLSVPALMKETS